MHPFVFYISKSKGTRTGEWYSTRRKYLLSSLLVTSTLKNTNKRNERLDALHTVRNISIWTHTRQSTAIRSLWARSTVYFTGRFQRLLVRIRSSQYGRGADAILYITPRTITPSMTFLKLTLLMSLYATMIVFFVISEEKNRGMNFFCNPLSHVSDVFAFH